MRNLQSLWHHEEGATMVEYGLLVAFIAMVALAGVQLVGSNLNSLFSAVGATV